MRTAALADICVVVTDGTHYTPPASSSGTPFLTVKDMKDGYLDFEYSARISSAEYERARTGNSAPVVGDVLFSKDGTVGKVHVVADERDFAVLSSIAILRPEPSLVQSGYLGHALRSPALLRGAMRSQTGSAIRRIILSDLERLTIPLPPLDEQQRTARVLDAIDALRSKQRASLVLQSRLPIALFVQMFGDPYASDGRWSRVPLVDVCEAINDCPHSTPVWVTEGPICLRTSNLSEGDWNWDDTRFVSEATFASRSTRGDLEPGDIVLSREGTVGVAAIVREGMRACMGQRLVQVRPSRQMTSEYLLRYLLSVLDPDRIARVMVGSTARHLNVKELRSLAVPIPPKNLQAQYAQSVGGFRRYRATAVRHLASLDSLFVSLQHRAFAGAI